MQTSPASAPITLYVWPGKWDLPSFEPASSVFWNATTPTYRHRVGQLPFLVHDQHTISTFPSIVKYITGLESSRKNDLDAALTPAERSQKVAWTSHVESHLGNLVYHTFYSNPENWEGIVYPALASMYDPPQRYYVPRRIRASYKPRLETAGLWHIPHAEPAKKRPFARDVNKDEKPQEKKKTFIQAFEREKIADKAKETLAIYARLLEGKQYIYQAKPSTLDLLLAAHVLLLIAPPFPDILIKELVQEWYTTLADHANRIRQLAFQSDLPKYSTRCSHNSLWDLLPHRRTIKPNSKPQESSPEDIQYNRLTWGFFGLALGSVAAYLAVVGPPIRITIARDENEDDEDGEDEDGEDEGEEDDEALELEELLEEEGE